MTLNVLCCLISSASCDGDRASTGTATMLEQEQRLRTVPLQSMLEQSRSSTEVFQLQQTLEVGDRSTRENQSVPINLLVQMHDGRSQIEGL